MENENEKIQCPLCPSRHNAEQIALLHFHLCKHCGAKHIACAEYGISHLTGTDRENNECEISRIWKHCNNLECKLRFKIDELESKLKDNVERIEELKTINSNHRNLMFLPSLAEQALENGNIFQSGISLYVAQMKPSLDAVSIDTMMYLLEYHFAIGKMYQDYVQMKDSRIKIREEIISKRKSENQATLDSEAAREIKKREAATPKPKTPYEKMFATYAKLMPAEAIDEFISKSFPAIFATKK